jgi:DNA-binding CsgD family transcriptional regulator
MTTPPTRNPANSGRRGRASANSHDLAWRRAEVLKMRRRGWSITRIAIELGVSASTISKDLDTVLTEHTVANITMLRALENERLDYILDKCVEVIEAAPGTKLAIAAAGRLIQVSARRSALNGLDVPIRIDHTVHEVDAQDRELQEILREAQARNEMTGQKLTADWHAESQQLDQHIGDGDG